MSSSLLPWFTALHSGEERAYHTTVPVDEAFLRAFRSTSFRIRTREQLHRQRHQVQDGGKKHGHNTTCKEAVSRIQRDEVTAPLNSKGARCGSRTSCTTTEDGDCRYSVSTAVPTATGSFVRTPSNNSSDNRAQEVDSTSTLNAGCIHNHPVNIDTLVDDKPVCVSNSQLQASLTSNSTKYSAPAQPTVAEYIHELLSNLVISVPSSASNSNATKSAPNNMASTIFTFSSSFLADPTHFFHVINTVLSDEVSSPTFLDGSKTWPEWYDGGISNGKHNSLTERRCIVHILALMDMRIRSAHRQWLRDEVVVVSAQSPKSIMNKQIQVPLFDYLESLDKKVKSYEAAPTICESESAAVQDFDNVLDGDANNDMALPKSPVRKLNKKKKKKKPHKKEQHATPLSPLQFTQPTASTSESSPSDDHIPSTNCNEGESRKSESSTPPSVNSNKENGVETFSLNAATAALSSSSTTKSHPLAEVNIPSKPVIASDHVLKPAGVEATPASLKRSHAKDIVETEVKDTKHATNEEESWTVVSKKSINSGSNQGRNKVKAVSTASQPPMQSHQQNYASVATSSSTNSIPVKAACVPTANVSVSPSVSSFASLLIPTSNSRTGASVATLSYVKTVSTQTKITFSSIAAAAAATVTRGHGVTNPMQQQDIASTSKVSLLNSPTKSNKQGKESRAESQGHAGTPLSPLRRQQQLTQQKNSVHKSPKIPGNLAIGTQTDQAITISKEKKKPKDTQNSQDNIHNIHNNSNGNINQRSHKNSYCSFQVTVRQAPTSPKKYHPQSYLSIQRQQSSGSATSSHTDFKGNRQLIQRQLSVPLIEQSLSSHRRKFSHALKPRSSTDESDARATPSGSLVCEALPVPILLGMESNSASSSVSSSLDAPSASVRRRRHRSENETNANKRCAKITEEGYHLLNSCEKLSADMDIFMKRRSAALICRRMERRLVLAALQGTVARMCPHTSNRRRRCHAEMYGSCATQLDLPSSDLDVVVRGVPLMPVDGSIGFGQGTNHHYYLPPHPNASNVLRLAAELEREPWAVHVKPIPTAMVPVVKILADPSRLPGASSSDSSDTPNAVSYPATQDSSPNALAGGPTMMMNQWRGADLLNGLLSVDITFEGPGHGGIGSTAFAAHVVQNACDETRLHLEATPLVQVFMVLKELLAQRRLNEPFSGGLSSYSLLLLVCAVIKDAKNLRRSLALSDTEGKQGSEMGELSSEESAEAASYDSSDGLTCVRDNYSADNPSGHLSVSDDFGLSSLHKVARSAHEKGKSRTVPSPTPCTTASSTDKSAGKPEDIALKKETLSTLGKSIATRSVTATMTSFSSDDGARNGTLEYLASNSIRPSCSFSFFAQGTGSNDILEVLCRGEPTPGKLLMHFLLFYGKLFDAKTTAINANANGSPFVPRKPGGSMDPATGMFSVDPIVIFDPLDGGECHNVARSCFAWYSVRQVFSQCYATLVQSIESHGSGVLDVSDTSPLLALLLSY